jgi:hypothetical protein
MGEHAGARLADAARQSPGNVPSNRNRDAGRISPPARLPTAAPALAPIAGVAVVVGVVA